MNPHPAQADIPNYLPDELVRTELLNYNNPEDLHPVEVSWRNLSRKLLKHVKVLEHHLAKVPTKSSCDEKFKLTNFPQPFSVRTKVEPTEF